MEGSPVSQKLNPGAAGESSPGPIRTGSDIRGGIEVDCGRAHFGGNCDGWNDHDEVCDDDSRWTHEMRNRVSRVLLQFDGRSGDEKVVSKRAGLSLNLVTPGGTRP